jgi:hypothetical protein
LNEGEDKVEYLKLAPDIDSDPDIEAAGWCAARVYELLLKVSAMKDKRGRLARPFQAPSWLAKRWNLTPADLPGVAPEDLIANGLVRLAALNLIHYENDELVISDWDKHYRPAKTSAERMADKRHRDAAKTSDAGDASDDTSHTSPTPPTPLHPPTPQGEAKAAAPFSGEAVPATITAPTRPAEEWSEVEFWGWAQSIREKGGYYAEGKPKTVKLERWWTEALMSEGITPPVLKEAFYNFGRSEHWGGVETPYPFAAFMSEWRKFLPPRRSARVAS